MADLRMKEAKTPGPGRGMRNPGQSGGQLTLCLIEGAASFRTREESISLILMLRASEEGRKGISRNPRVFMASTNFGANPVPRPSAAPQSNASQHALQVLRFDRLGQMV